MAAERKPGISPEKRQVLETDLRVPEVDNLREVQANYHQFAEAVKPILKQAAAKLIKHGIFPEEEVTGGETVQILDVAYEAENSLRKVVVDTEWKMFVCNQKKQRRYPGDPGDYIIDWDSRTEATDEDYVDFSLPTLNTMADEFREALGMDKMASPIPFHSRW